MASQPPRSLASGLYDYRDLDLAGGAEQAVARMEWRAQEPASRRMFETLIEPLIRRLPVVGTVLELGCGTASLSRRIKALRPDLKVQATDKSLEMVQAAQALAAKDGVEVEIDPWDACALDVLPRGAEAPDLVISSVMVPYLASREVEELVRFLNAALEPCGQLAFLEQDVRTDSLMSSQPDVVARMFAKDERAFPIHAGLGMRDLLLDQGLEVSPLESFLWTAESYGPYLRDLFSRVADDAVSSGRTTEDEWHELQQDLEQRTQTGRFHYGLVYHLIVGSP